MPPLSFCYWRCYHTEPRSFRKMVNIYAGSQVDTIRQIAPAGAGGVSDGLCQLTDDMFYCGATNCEKCDYEF